MPLGKMVYKTRLPSRPASETAIQELALLWLSRAGGFKTAGACVSLLLWLRTNVCDLGAVVDENLTMRRASKKTLRGLIPGEALSMAGGG
jgi:hypothetical protein